VFLYINQNTCDLIVGGSPKPWTGAFDPNPTKIETLLIRAISIIFHIIVIFINLLLAKNRSSCKIQIAFKQSKEASIRLHKVNILLHLLNNFNKNSQNLAKQNR
jgi:hypothetical protein